MAICIGGRTPVFSCDANIRVILGLGGVEVLNDVELGLIEFRVLRLEEVVALVDGIGLAFGNEGRSLVAHVSPDCGELEVTTCIEEIERVARDEVKVEGRVVGEDGVGCRVGEAGDDILLLQDCCVQAAQAGKSITAASIGSGASGTLDEGIILVLRLVDRA